MADGFYSSSVTYVSGQPNQLLTTGAASGGAALSISSCVIPSDSDSNPHASAYTVTKAGINFATLGVAAGDLVEGDNIKPHTYVSAVNSATQITLSRLPTTSSSSNITNATLLFHTAMTGAGTSTAKMGGFGIVAGSNMTVTPTTSNMGRPIFTIASTASGTGDVSAASNFGTTNVMIRADGTSKGVKHTGIVIDNSDNMSGIGTISSGAITATGTSTFATAIEPDADDGATIGSANKNWSDVFLADGAVLNFGDDQDVTLTHVADAGLTLNGALKLHFGDTGTYIHQSADGVLDLVSDTEIEINATTIDMNGNLELSGDITVSGNTVTFGNGAIFENSSSSLLTITEATTRVLGVASVHNTTASSATEGGKLQLSADDGAVMADNHRLGVIEFLGAEDTSNTLSIGARIQAICRDAWDGSNNDADLEFYTTDGTTESLVLTLDADKLATFAGAVTIAGDLTVSGTTTQVDSTTLTTADAMFSMGTGQTANNADALDFGFYGTYDVSGTQRYAGLLRDASDSGTFKFFTTTGGTHAEPTTTVNTTSGFTLAPVDMGALAATTGAFSSTLAATTGTFSGVLKTDDTTDATSTTDGSLQTDGGLSVAKDGIFGNDLYLLNDSAVLGLGAGKDVTITHDGSTGATLASAGAFIIDCEADITLNANGGDILFADASASFGSITNSSGTMQIKAAAAKGIELRSNLGMTFLIEDDATDAAGVANIFQFTTEGLTGTDLTGVDGEMENVVCQYTSGSTVLGRTEFGKVVQLGGAGSNNTLFTFDSSVFSACEILIHTVTAEGVSGDGLHQVNKMIVCANSMEGGGTDTVTFSNYSIIYSDGSTELASFTASISSDTVSVQFDATDNDVLTYAVTFLA